MIPEHSERASRRQSDLTAKQAAWALVAICVLSTVLGRLVYAPCDDAYIFYVYAKNLAGGNGLTYNGTVVWGFSSILWPGLLGLVGLLGVPVHVGGEILSALSGWFALWATYLLGRSLGLSRLRALLPALLLAATADFAFYSSVGLEQALFTGLVALAAAAVAWERYVTTGGVLAVAAVMAGMVLIRFEGALICALLLLVMAVRLRSLRTPLICGILLVGIFAPFWIAFRLYFGSWLPNTFYIKSNAGLANLRQGLDYLRWSLPRYRVVAALGMLAGVWALARRRRSRHPLSWSWLVITAVWLAYVVLQGGDNMVGGRLLIPVLPLAYVALADLAPPAPAKVLAPIAVLVCATLYAPYFLDERVIDHRGSWERSFVIRYRAGMYLRDQFPPGTVVALNPAGIVPYYSELPTIDMLGLNDWTIAHEGKRDYELPYGHQAGDGEYVLSRQPGVILFGGPSHSDRPATSAIRRSGLLRSFTRTMRGLTGRGSARPMFGKARLRALSKQAVVQTSPSGSAAVGVPQEASIQDRSTPMVSQTPSLPANSSRLACTFLI